MTATQVLSELRALGIQAEVRGGKLRIRPAEAVNAELLEALREHKAEIVTILSNGAHCGSPDCNGCYEVEPGVRIHPPKSSQEWLEWLVKWEPKTVPRVQ